MSRLEPTKTKSSPAAAIEVKPNAAVEVKSSESKPGHLQEMKWRDAGAAENERRAEDAAKANNEAAKSEAASKEAYKKYYEQETSTNGCSVPLTGYFPKGSWPQGWNEDPDVVKACNEHDVDYGRGGNPLHRLIADVKLGWKIGAAGQPVRALVTFSGVRVGGPLFFHYRRGGRLPIPEGQ